MGWQPCVVKSRAYMHRAIFLSHVSLFQRGCNYHHSCTWRGHILTGARLYGETPIAVHEILVRAHLDYVCRGRFDGWKSISFNGNRGSSCRCYGDNK